jgi:hypothetical protein
VRWRVALDGAENGRRGGGSGPTTGYGSFFAGAGAGVSGRGGHGLWVAGKSAGAGCGVGRVRLG